MPRADFKAIKFLYQRYGLKTAMEWQRLPFVDLTSHDLNSPAEITKSAAGAFDHLPWMDAVYLPSATEQVTVVFRIKRFTEKEQPPVCDCGCCPDAEDAILLATVSLFESAPGALTQFIVDNRTGNVLSLLPDRVYGCQPKNMREVATAFTQGVAAHARYLAQCPEHLVEVRPTDIDRRRGAAKTAAKKPWLRDDLPRVILLDPTQAREHGHRVDRGGTHASPIPHQRRGHWRRLRAERFKEKRAVWVRPAWVGELEWIHRGSRYKVLQLETGDRCRRMQTETHLESIT